MPHPESVPVPPNELDFRAISHYNRIKSNRPAGDTSRHGDVVVSEGRIKALVNCRYALHFLGEPVETFNPLVNHNL